MKGDIDNKKYLIWFWAIFIFPIAVIEMIDHRLGIKGGKRAVSSTRCDIEVIAAADHAECQLGGRAADAHVVYFIIGGIII